MSVLGPGNVPGSGDVDYRLGRMYLLDTFWHNSEVVDIFIVISALQIRKLVLKEEKRPIPVSSRGHGLGER